MLEWLNKSKGIYEKLGLTAKVKMIDEKISEFQISLSEKEKTIVREEATA